MCSLQQTGITIPVPTFDSHDGNPHNGNPSLASVPNVRRTGMAVAALARGAPKATIERPQPGMPASTDAAHLPGPAPTIRDAAHLPGPAPTTERENRPDLPAPTDPAQVTPETPLTALNLNWRERDLPEQARTKHVHRLHPYLGKFIPQLVEVFLRRYFAPGQTVLDPFAGSGTTLVQANELGVHAIGYDVSAFNVLLCRAKLARYDLGRVRSEVLDILEKVSRDGDDGGVDGGGGESGSSDDRSSKSSDDGDEADSVPASAAGYLRHWFHPRALQQLLAYRQLIDTEGYEYRDLLKIILSRAARSARLVAHFELDFPKHPRTGPYWCHKHARTCVPATDALKFLRRYSTDTLERIAAFARVRTGASAAIYHADSRTALFPSVDGVITSPPYVGLIDYHAQHAYAYQLLGLEERRADEIGSPSGGSGWPARERYQREIEQVFARALAAMPAGGRLIIVAADRARLYPAIAARLGVEQEAILHRDVNRRTGMRAQAFGESIFIWRKP